MTKKRIIDVTSIKKRDTMLPWSNSTSANQTGGTQYTTNPAIVVGGQNSQSVACFAWCATARDATIASNNAQFGTRYNLSTRSSTNCYMIGLKEAIEVQVSTGMPWQWRRICFTIKGPFFANTSSFAVGIETSNGWTRVLNQVSGNTGGGDQYTLFEKLFKGQNTVDWIDPMIAKVDTSRVTLKYDKTVSLASGNEDGFIRKYNKWHSMYSTLVYNDDELGGGETSASYSTIGKAGMGDYYVIDMFRARDGSTASDQLSFRPCSTLYWHEK